MEVGQPAAPRRAESTADQPNRAPRSPVGPIEAFSPTLPALCSLRIENQRRPARAAVQFPDSLKAETKPAQQHWAGTL